MTDESSCGADTSARFGRLSSEAEPADLAMGRAWGRARTGLVGERDKAGDEIRGCARAVELERVSPAAGRDDVSELEGKGTRDADGENSGRMYEKLLGGDGARNGLVDFGGGNQVCRD